MTVATPIGGVAPTSRAEPAVGDAGDRDASPPRLAPVEWVVPAVGALWVGAVLAVTWPAPWHDSIRSLSMADASVFALAGEQIRRGGVPYVSYWDHKPPLIHLLNAAGLALSGGHMWGIWLLSLAGFVAGIALCYAATRRLLGVAAAILATLYLSFSLPSILAADLPGGYALPLQWGAVAVLGWWNAARRDRSLAAGAALGVLTSAAVLLKPNQGGAGAAVALTMVVVLAAYRDWRALGRLVLGGVAATLAVAAVTVAYLAYEHAVAAFLDEVLRYNGAYAGLTTQKQRLRTAIFGVQTASNAGSLLLPGAGWLLAVAQAWARRRDLGAQPALVLAVLWLPLEVALASASGRQFPNYFVMLFAPLAYLAGLLAAEVTRLAAASRATAGDRRAPATFLAAVCVALVGSAASRTVLAIRDDTAPARRAAVVDSTVAYVRAHTSPGEPIFVWGHAADIYLLSGRPPASRFIYPLPLLTPGYADSALVDGFMAELRAAAPALIVGVSGRGLDGEDLTPPLNAWDPNWQVPKRGEPDLWRSAPWWTMTPGLRAFYDYVAQNYTLATTIAGRWPVYRRITPRPTARAAAAPPSR